MVLTSIFFSEPHPKEGTKVIRKIMSWRTSGWYGVKHYLSTDGNEVISMYKYIGDYNMTNSEASHCGNANGYKEVVQVGARPRLADFSFIC